jgi:poly(3-hydroxybutyrate) depolymerase
MMGGPIDARKSPTAVNDLAENRSFEWFENNVVYRVPAGFPGAGRLVYPGFLQYTGFIAMNPRRHAVNHYDYFKNLIKGDDANTEAHRAFYDEYNAVLDMDADFYLETIKTVFQDFNLMHGTWDVRSPEGKIERVRPQDIRNSALLTVEGELDDIAGLGQTRAAHDLCTHIAGKEQRHLTVEGAGHYGIFSGSRWRTVVYPKVRDFILEHQKALKPASAPAAPATKAEKPAAVAPAVKQTAKPAVPAVPAAAKVAVAPAPKKVPTAAKVTASKPAPRPRAKVAAPKVALKTEATAAGARPVAPASATAPSTVTPTTRWATPEGNAPVVVPVSAAATTAPKPEVATVAPAPASATPASSAVPASAVPTATDKA